VERREEVEEIHLTAGEKKGNDLEKLHQDLRPGEVAPIVHGLAGVT
jgi:hypothetical protein